jgi:hypothetical protein
MASQKIVTPTITSLDPQAVPADWHGTLRIMGNGFDNGSFVLIDGAVPRSNYKSPSLIEADITPDITRVPGTKTVKVHTGRGDLSNEKTWTIERAAMLDRTTAGYGRAKIKSYLVEAICDRTQYSRRTIKMLDLENVAGTPFTGVTLIFVDDNPLTDLGSAGGFILARTLHRDFDDMYQILRSEKTAYFAWGSDESNKLTWFTITTDGRP